MNDWQRGEAVPRPRWRSQSTAFPLAPVLNSHSLLHTLSHTPSLRGTLSHSRTHPAQCVPPPNDVVKAQMVKEAAGALTAAFNPAQAGIKAFALAGEMMSTCWLGGSIVGVGAGEGGGGRGG